MIKERPILFSTDMVKAILDGRKGQTRRVSKLDKINTSSNDWDLVELRQYHGSVVSFNNKTGSVITANCLYGGIGSLLWVKETHYLFGHWIKNGLIKTGKQKWKFRNEIKGEVFYQDSKPDYIKTKKTERGWFKRPSIFMPRWASRITLEITNIRVERLQEITQCDAFAEGMTREIASHLGISVTPSEEEFNLTKARSVFIGLWDSINAKRGYSWESNPFVWVIEFKKVK